MNSDDLLIPIAIGAFVSLLIMILIIRWAVAPYLNDIVREIKRSNRLKYLDLKKKGVTDTEISNELSKEK